MASSTPSTVPPPGSRVPGGAARPTEIKVVSHSNLFYWWPVWALAFFMAAWTYVENHRLAVVPASGLATKNPDGSYDLQFKRTGGEVIEVPALEDAVRKSGTSESMFPARVSNRAWLGGVFLVGLALTVVITNVPLRGLWSFVTIILVVLLALMASLFELWDNIFLALGNLRIYINMAGYLFIGACVFVLWVLATYVFDRRSYVIFTAGQMRVCEHIGAAVQTYNTMGVGLEKERDDLFRHYILGFGSGDLILKIPAADKREVRLPNVLFIGWRLKTIEDMLRSVNTTTSR